MPRLRLLLTLTAALLFASPALADTIPTYLMNWPAGLCVAGQRPRRRRAATTRRAARDGSVSTNSPLLWPSGRG